MNKLWAMRQSGRDASGMLAFRGRLFWFGIRRMPPARAASAGRVGHGSKYQSGVGNAIARSGGLEGALLHSDRGTQYSSESYRRMSKAGYPYDNSPMESFFASLKKAYFYRREYATIQDVERDLFYYIEVFYKRKRLHSSLGYMSPAAYRMKKMGQKAG